MGVCNGTDTEPEFVTLGCCRPIGGAEDTILVGPKEFCKTEEAADGGTGAADATADVCEACDDGVDEVPDDCEEAIVLLRVA